MSDQRDGTVAPEVAGNTKLAILLAMAMFVLVVDTSLMNVSISAVVRDLDTTVSGVQSAIALEALVSAASILIGSKVGDLIGRERPTSSASWVRHGRARDDPGPGPRAIIIFWASSVASEPPCCCRPCSLGARELRRRSAAQAYALVGAAAAIAAAVGPSRGVRHDLPVLARGVRVGGVIIAVVLPGSAGQGRSVHRAPGHRPVGAVLSVLGMGGVVLEHPGVAGGR